MPSVSPSYGVIKFYTSYYRTLWTAVNCERFCFLASLVCVCCLWKISGTAERNSAKFLRKTWFVPRLENFKDQGQRSKVNVTRDKNRHFSAVSAACVWFVFGKTSLPLDIIIIVIIIIIFIILLCFLASDIQPQAHGRFRACVWQAFVCYLASF